MGTIEHRKRLWTRQIRWNVIVQASALRKFRQPARWRQSRDGAKNEITQVVETVVTINNSPVQDYTHPAGRSSTYHITPGLTPFSIVPTSLFNLCPVLPNFHL